MKNSSSSTVRTLVVTFALALSLTINSAVARSDVSREFLDVTTASNDGPIIGNGSRSALSGCLLEVRMVASTEPSTTAGVSPAVLIIDDGSNTRRGDIDVTRHSNFNNIGSKSVDVQTTLRDLRPVSILGLPVENDLIDAPLVYGSPLPMTGSPNSVAPTGCRLSGIPGIDVALPENTSPNLFINRVTAHWNKNLCIGRIEVGSSNFTGTAVSPITMATLPIGNAVGNSVVKATLSDVSITTTSIKRDDASSSNVRIGGIVIR